MKRTDFENYKEQTFSRAVHNTLDFYELQLIKQVPDANREVSALLMACVEKINDLESQVDEMSTIIETLQYAKSH